MTFHVHGCTIQMLGCSWPKEDRTVITPQRRRAAEKAVRRELEALPLFPDYARETARFQTAEARLGAAQEGRTRVGQHHRSWYAASVWRARRRLLELHPAHARALLEEFASGMQPKDPYYLLDFLRHRLPPRQGGTGSKGARKRIRFIFLGPRAMAAKRLGEAADALRGGDARRGRYLITSAHAAIEAARLHAPLP